MTLETFLEYAEHVYNFLVLATVYWPITLLVIMYIIMYKTWNYYLAIMHLKHIQEDLELEGKDFGSWQKAMAYPSLFIGLGWDILLNFIVGSIVFIELPRELLFTSRVSRWNDNDGWRGKLARWFCRVWLDPFEEGGHCS